MNVLDLNITVLNYKIIIMIIHHYKVVQGVLEGNFSQPKLVQPTTGPTVLLLI